VDYLGGSQNGGHDYNWGLGIAERTGLTAGKSWSPYVGAGVGAYYQDVNNFYTHHYTTLGGKLFLGIQQSQGLFVEASYNLLASHQDVSPSAFALEVGVRF
jgi:hypothetical protein